MGWAVIGRSIVNSIITSGSALCNHAAAVQLLSGYVFARHRFPAKEIIYTGILALLMIPTHPDADFQPNVLILNMGLENTYWALILPVDIRWSGVCASALPQLLRDPAGGIFRRRPYRRRDRTSGVLADWRCRCPSPILVTVAVVRLVTTYNQFMWPLVAISSP